MQQKVILRSVVRVFLGGSVHFGLRDVNLRRSPMLRVTAAFIFGAAVAVYKGVWDVCLVQASPCVSSMASPDLTWIAREHLLLPGSLL